MNWIRALGECVHVMAELHAVREAGFDSAALALPRNTFALRLLCAFNGAPAGWVPPRGWRYFPNMASARAWGRVIEAAPWAPDALTLFHAWGGHGNWPNEPTRKAWERVHAAVSMLAEVA